MSEQIAKSSESSRHFNWRRLFQFRLRTILILTTIIAVWLGWWNKARQQREAVTGVCEAGFVVVYDESLPWTSGMAFPPKWPSWLLDRVDRDYFATAREVTHVVSFKQFKYVPITDKSLESLKRLPNLRGVDLNGKPVTDVGLKNLIGMTGIQRINLHATRVTDEGLEYLKGLTALQDISLGETQITDAGLDYLKGLNLHSLDLGETHITDAGLQRLKGLTSLKFLYLRNTKITNGGLEHLKSLTSLYVLDLSNTNVSSSQFGLDQSVAVSR